MEEMKKSRDWLSTTQLSLTHQMHSAMQEIDSYILRVHRESSSLEEYRKKLYNEIQELRGNIRVFARIRPRLTRELEESTEVVRYTLNEDSSAILIQSNSRPIVTGNTEVQDAHHFGLDFIFKPEAPQEDVFTELSQLVQSALDGFNVSIFAYGQTGSGKTYTMLGPDEAVNKLSLNGSVDRDLGMIPRAVELIFDTIRNLKSKGWKYSVTASILEIYNETIRDLLFDLPNSTSTNSTCDIKFDPKGNVVVNSRIVPVCDSVQVFRLLGHGAKARACAATSSNEHSSRSHSVFQLTISGENTFGGQKLRGVLSLIDLAGSERVSSSGVIGERLKETQAINKSLSCLGDVIAALAVKQSHIPHRNSKLTLLLKDSLGGDAKTLMLVNMSPLQTHLGESLNSLRFAVKVNACTKVSSHPSKPKRL